MNMMPQKKFYLVWNLLRRMPTVTHDTRESAEAEAERLARANPGYAFFVVEAKAFHMKADVVRMELS